MNHEIVCAKNILNVLKFIYNLHVLITGVHSICLRTFVSLISSLSMRLYKSSTYYINSAIYIYTYTLIIYIFFYYVNSYYSNSLRQSRNGGSKNNFRVSVEVTNYVLQK